MLHLTVPFITSFSLCRSLHRRLQQLVEAERKGVKMRRQCCEEWGGGEEGVRGWGGSGGGQPGRCYVRREDRRVHDSFPIRGIGFTVRSVRYGRLTLRPSTTVRQTETDTARPYQYYCLWRFMITKRAHTCVRAVSWNITVFSKLGTL